MTLTGDMLIGASSVRVVQASQRAFNPTTNAEIAEPSFGLGGAEEVDRAAALAAEAFNTYRAAPLSERAAFLETIADNIIAIGDPALVEALRQTERAFLSSTRLGGRVAVRFCFINWRTTAADVEEVVTLLVRLGGELAGA